MPDDVFLLDDDAFLLDVETVATRLDVNPTTGLSDAEAARRLEADGPNELRGTPPVPTWRKILAQFQDPLIYLLLAAVAVSLVAWIVEGAHGAPVDAIVIAAIIILNAILGYTQEAKAADAVAALGAMTAATSTVLRGASTLSQQVSKNLFLWSGRSWLRKGLEAWFTALIEVLWRHCCVSSVPKRCANGYMGWGLKPLSAAPAGCFLPT